MLDTDDGATIVSGEESDDEPKTIRGKIAKVRATIVDLCGKDGSVMESLCQRISLHIIRTNNQSILILHIRITSLMARQTL